MMTEQSLHLFSALEVAEELALRDAELLRRITPEEIRNGAWMHDKKKEELAPNVLAMVHAFNSLAQLVPTEVLVEEKVQQRAKVVSAYIKIAKKCYDLKNYNSLNALLAGLLCTPLHRLKKTWKEVPSKRRRQLTFLNNLMSEEGNWRLYKKEISKQMATNSACIIFLGVFLSHVVKYESYHKLKRISRSSSHSPPPQCRRVSMYETFTVLEAITVRHRLESLRMSQSGGGRYSSSHDQMLTLDDIDEERDRCKISRNKTILAKQASVTDGLVDDDEGQGQLRERLVLLSNSSDADEDSKESDGDVSPDHEWSQEVCHEADRRTRSRSRALSLIKRGRSLEQLLQVCQLDEQTLYARSRSVPKLLSSGTLQVWMDESKLEMKDCGTCSHPFPHLTTESAASNSHSGFAHMDTKENGLTEETECSESENSPSHNQCTNTPHTVCLTRYKHVTPNERSRSVIERNSVTCTPKISFTAPQRLRKRHTASDEMHVLQLHLARDKPSSDPPIMLKQYQVLSLSYSMSITTSPYIRELLDKCKTTTEAHNYRQSYILEST